MRFCPKIMAMFNSSRDCILMIVDRKIHIIPIFSFFLKIYVSTCWACFSVDLRFFYFVMNLLIFNFFLFSLCYSTWIVQLEWRTIKYTMTPCCLLIFTLYWTADFFFISKRFRFSRVTLSYPHSRTVNRLRLISTPH